MQTLQPMGLQPAFHISGRANPRSQLGFVNSAPASALYENQPVKNVGGQIVPITAATDVIVGVFAGLQYIDATGAVKQRNTIAAGQPLLPGTANNGDTYSNSATPYLYMDPAMEFVIQGNGPLAKTAVGQSFNIDMTTINQATPTGISKVLLDAVGGPIAALAGQVIVTELYQVPGNVWGDPYTMVKVKMNNNI